MFYNYFYIKIIIEQNSNSVICRNIKKGVQICLGPFLIITAPKYDSPGAN